jgi:hypothetical protein
MTKVGENMRARRGRKAESLRADTEVMKDGIDEGRVRIKKKEKSNEAHNLEKICSENLGI